MSKDKIHLTRKVVHIIYTLKKRLLNTNKKSKEKTKKIHTFGMYFFCFFFPIIELL